MKYYCMHNEKGATLVESSVALVFLLILVIIVVDLFRVSYIRLSMQFTLTDAARQSFVYVLTPSDFKTRITDKLSRLRVGYSSATDKITACPIDNWPCTAGSVALGGRGDFVVFTLSKQVDLFFFGKLGYLFFESRGITLQARVMGRNEPA